MGFADVTADRTKVHIFHFVHIFPWADHIIEQVVQYAHMIAVEVIEVTACLITGADVIFILEPFAQLLLHLRIGAILQLDHPIVQSPAIYGDCRVHDEHDEMFVIHALEALGDLFCRQIGLFLDHRDVEDLRIVLIE